MRIVSENIPTKDISSEYPSDDLRTDFGRRRMALRYIFQRFSSLYLRRSLSEEEASSLETMQSVDLCNVSSSASRPLTAPAPVISESLDFRPPGSKPNRRTQSTPPWGPIVRWWLYWSVPPEVSGSLINHSLERLPTERFLVNMKKRTFKLTKSGAG